MGGWVGACACLCACVWGACLYALPPGAPPHAPMHVLYMYTLLEPKRARERERENTKNTFIGLKPRTYASLR